jgi:hypothetical protein
MIRGCTQKEIQPEFIALNLIKNNDWEDPIKEFSSDDYKKVILYIEYHLNQVTTTWWK